MVEGQEGVSWPQWLAIARACEEHGIRTLLRSDHYMPLDDGAPPADALDAWGTICALAAVTETLELGTLVSPATFRHPAVTAKLAATADQISGGRVSLGLGAGWHDGEHETFGFGFPPLKERMDELERQLDTIARHWSDEHPSRPKPQRPRLIMGGAAKPRGAALAARHADEYNVVYASHDEIRERRASIQRACEEAGRPMMRFSLMTGFLVGRDRDEIERRREALRERGSTPRDVWICGTPDQARQQLDALAGLGVDRVMMQMLLHDDVEQVALLAELESR